jgi:hypothetical protein
MIAASRHPVEQGWMPPLVRHHHQPGGSLLCAGAFLGLLLCHDTDLCLLIGVGPRLLHMWWPSSCRHNSLLGKGSWIVERVSSPCMVMDR